MVLFCTTPPAPLRINVAATRLLIPELTTSIAAREHVRALAATTYGRCVLGLAGFLTFVTENMAAFVKCMGADVSANDLKMMHEMLQLLAQTVIDEDNATFIARIGAHPLLMRLMEHENEDIQEAAAEVVARCTSSPSAITFPHRVRQVAEVERVWPRAVPLPFDPRDNAPTNADGSQSTIDVLIRQVPIRMTGQRKTGYLLWGAAFVLARWIHKHRDLFFGKSLIEVGSGLGLGGITAARYASQTTLTDYQADTCTALEYNVQLNKPFTHELDPAKPEVKVMLLDWDVTASIEGVPKAQIVLGSDIICEPSTAEGFLRVVRHHLLSEPNGVAYLMNANSHSRFGVTHLHALLAASTDLSYCITPVDKLRDGIDLLETVTDAQELSYELYEIHSVSY
ncbi:unnamed protein product [Peronospora belbahrii]|uniref:FAM86 N-terminal domain-containing protein n=1 Tax=Peronospora belbahrii TaxID=622444 RepID=A0AAU9LAZ6_9STRA|nr:unnamed protein product [Peronospora belbahrii]CAH0517970.1 unnamed protein product [Peronospora belbahrii]